MSIDNKVVKMSFDNSNFEKNAKTTIGTLSKLKSSLNFDGAYDGLMNIDKAAKGTNFEKLASAVEGVKVKFSTLQVVALTALQNITNKAVDAGSRLLKSLTIDPVAQGFSEYELKMGSVQTIMAGTGASLDQVMKKLNELNTYADKTIYSFKDMTSNIGKFTNAGVSLNDSVAAIQGVANVAAISGANAEQASHSMYNFAQALSAGYVKLIDWKSIEVANMATVQFKKELIDTAVQVGTLTKKGDKYISTTKDLNGHISEAFNSTRNFNESLSSQWMTTKVLTKTLARYSDETTEIGKKATAAAQDVKTFHQLIDTLQEAVGSGWAETWEIIFGDFEEGKELWTGVNNVLSDLVGTLSTARNDLLFTGLSTGWKQLVDSSTKDSEALKDVIMNVADTHNIAIDDMIEKEGSFEDTLSSGWLSKDILSESLDKYAKKLHNMSKKQKDNAGITKEQVEEFDKFYESVKKDGSILDDFVEKIQRQSGRENIIQALANSFKFLGQIIKPIKEAFRDVFEPLSGEKLYSVTEAILKFTEKLKVSGEQAAHIHDIFETVFKVIKLGLTIFKTFATVIGKLIMVSTPLIDVFLNIADGIATVIGKITNVNKETETFISGSLTNLIDGLGKIIEVFSRLINGIFDKVSSALQKFAESVNTVDGVMGTMNLVGLASIIKMIHDAGGIFKVISDKIDDLGGFAKILDSVRETLETYQSKIKADIIRSIALSMIFLAGAIAILSSIDPSRMKAVAEGLALMMSAMSIAMLLLTKVTIKPKQVTTTVLAMKGITNVILTMSIALKILSTIDSKQMGSSIFGLIGISLMLGKLINIIAAIDKKKLTKGFTSLMFIATSILILSVAVKKMGNMQWDNLLAGVLALGAIGYGVSNFLQSMEFVSMDNVAKLSTGMLMISASMVVFAKAVNVFGSMKIEELGKGVGAVASLLTIIGIFTSKAKTTDMSVGAGRMIALSIAIDILAKSVKQLGTLKLESILKGLLGLSGALGAVVAALAIMNKIDLGNTSNLLLISVAVNGLALALVALSAVPMPALITGLLGLGTALTIILAFAKPLTALGPALITAGAGLTLFSAGLLILTTAITMLGVAMVSLSTGITTVLATFGSLGAFFAQLVNGLSAALQAVLNVIIVNAPLIAKAISALLRSLLTAFQKNQKLLINTFMKFILNVLSALEKYTPRIISKLANLLTKMLLTLANHLPKMIDAGIKLIVALVNGVAEGVRNNKDAMAKAILNLISALGSAAKEMMHQVIQIGKDIIAGLIDGIKQKLVDAKDAIAEGVSGVINKAKEILDINSPSKVFIGIGASTMEGFVLGIRRNSKSAATETENAMNTTIVAVKNAAKRARETLANVDDSLTIRPVMDLTEIQNGIGTINSMFGKQQTLGIDYSLRQRKMNNQRRAEETTQAVIDFIKNNKPDQERLDEQRPIELHTTVDIDGRQVAKSTARYTKAEIDRINKYDNRKKGIK